MPITFICPNCQCKMTVPDTLAGKHGNCSKCKGTVTVPATTNGVAPPAAAAAVPAAKPPAPANKVAPAQPGPRVSEPARAAKTPAPPAKVAPPAAAPKPPAKPEAPEEPPADLEAAAMDVLADEAAEIQAAKDASFIEFECPMCNEPVKLAAEHGGKKHPCPNCKRIIAVPMPKIEQRTSWRDTGPKLPSAAKRDDMPELEGAWGSTKKTGPSQEALKEAGVIVEKRKPLTLMQKLRPYLLVGVPLVLLLGGVLFLWDWMNRNKEKQAFDLAVLYAGTDKNREVVGAEGLAGLHAETAAYHLRVGRPGCAAKAHDEIIKAVALAGASNNPESDALLLDLSGLALELGGSGEQLANGTHLKWDDAQKDLRSVLGGIKTPEVRLEALRRVSAGLVERDEVARAMALVAQLNAGEGADQSESLAVVGLELLRLGKKDEAIKLADRAEKPYREKKDKDRPPIRAAVIALAQDLGRPLDKLQPTKNATIDDQESFIRGKAMGMARVGNLEPAQKLADEEITSLPAETVRARVAIIVAAAENKKADASAFEMVLTKCKEGKPWVVLHLIDSALRAGVSVEKVEPAAAGMSGPLAGWAQLLLLRARLANSRSVESADSLDKFPAKSLAARMARLELSRHNMRHNRDWFNTVQTWDEPAQAFGALGVAQGFHKEK